jgi:hypothetical protein
MDPVPDSPERRLGSSLTTERGFALALALFAMVVIGALVSGNFLAGWLEAQAGHNSLFAAQAFEGAEAGLEGALSGAEEATLEALAPGGAPLELEPLSLDGGVTVTVQISRLTTVLYLIRSTGIKRNGGGMALANRSLGAVARIVPMESPSEPGVIIRRLVPIAQRGWVPLF